MRRTYLNDWIIKNNELKKSLENLDLTIKMFTDSNSHIFFLLEIIDSDKKRLEYSFLTLEDTINFIERVVVNSKSLDDIAKAFYNLLLDMDYDVDEEDDKEKITNNRLDLDSTRFINEITDYYSDGLDYKVYISYEVSNIGEAREISFFITDYIIDGEEVKETKKKLKDEEIKEVIEDIIRRKSYEMDNINTYKIRQIKYLFNGDTPHFKGVRVCLRQLEKPRKLNLNKRVNNE